MKDNIIKISALVVFVASVSILLGIAVYKTQPKPALPVEPLLTQAPSTPSAMPPLPTSPPLSAAMLENLFGNSLCSWPCWQGVTPGMTTSSEALQRLNDSPLVSENSLHLEGSETEFEKADWHWKLDEKWLADDGKIEWRDGIVFDILLNTYYHDVSLGEIINRFGPPKKLDVINCTEVVEGPQWWCATLYYVEKGFEIHISWSRIGSEDIQITSSDPIGFVVLFKPTTIEDRLSHFGLKVQDINLQDWKGYGKLLDLYVPDP